MNVKVVSSEAMTRIDSRSQAEFAIPSTILMEDAGVKAWALARRILRAEGSLRGRLVFVAGKGNNGGDALVMARQAHFDGVRRLSVILAGGRPAEGSDPATMLAMCAALGIECIDWPSRSEDALARIREAAWLFDGITGTGLRGALRPPLAALVAPINASRARRLAIDVPSGVGDELREGFPAVRADVTLTMGLPKLCLYLPHARVSCGRIHVVPVGFPPTLLQDPDIPGELLAHSAWRGLAPEIPADTHKNRRGHLAVFAGARGTTGAAWLCASAAARSRVGLVTVFVDSDAYPTVAQKLTSVMCRPWDAPGAAVTAGAERGPRAAGGSAAADASTWDPSRFSAVLAGPGWGLSEGKERWLGALLGQGLSGVIDADGLTLLGRIAARGRMDLGGRWVLTPHPGEFSRLTGIRKDEVLDDPVKHAVEASARLNAVIALKGPCTVVCAPQGRYWILDGSNPALATGGSGDVLAGIIAAGVAGGMSPLDAALFGVSLHARVGRMAARSAGWFLAEDLVPLISRVLSR
jgi:ADP-dependent NAD(P)H-hydrate dehydratase / NAD(P)H-hydrate epimerase